MNSKVLSAKEQIKRTLINIERESKKKKKKGTAKLSTQASNIVKPAGSDREDGGDEMQENK